MKKIIILFAFASLFQVKLSAAIEHSGVAILGVKSDGTLTNIKADDSGNIKVIGGNAANEAIYIALASTISAQLAIASRSGRIAYNIANRDSVYDIYKATYAASSSDLSAYKSHTSTAKATGFKKISANTEFADSQSPYTGAIYVIGDSTDTRIEIIEKW